VPRLVDPARHAGGQLAAGEIHSDIQRGFIRAEVVRVRHLLARGTLAACREHGELRLEGKDYLVQDGDVINFRTRRRAGPDAHGLDHPHDSRLRSAGALRPRRRRVHVRELVKQLRARGYEAELVSVPFKWYPKEEILPHAAAWRLLDLSESNGLPIDLVIATKFPTYFVRHPRKVTWLIHQYRAAYELCGTPYSDFDHTWRRTSGCATRASDSTRGCCGECRRVFTNAREHGRPAGEVQRHRPSRCIIRRGSPRACRPGPYGDYVLSVGRIESRQARGPRHRSDGARADPFALIVAGDGTQRANTERTAEAAGVRRPGDVPRGCQRRGG
jgi:hypothetical protein